MFFFHVAVYIYMIWWMSGVHIVWSLFWLVIVFCYHTGFFLYYNHPQRSYRYKSIFDSLCCLMLFDQPSVNLIILRGHIATSQYLMIWFIVFFHVDMYNTWANLVVFWFLLFIYTFYRLFLVYCYTPIRSLSTIF